MPLTKEPLGGYRHICPICGEDFRGWTDWAFKKRAGPKTIYFCSWKCRRKDELETEERKGRKKCTESTTTAL